MHIANKFNMLKFVALIAFMAIATMVQESYGHGYLFDPPNRSSAWRLLPGFPANYDDNQIYCGGFGIQHNINGGKCGLCGDDFRQARPRDNENGGKYGTGQKVATYKSGEWIDLYVKLSANHMGYFVYSVCKLNSAGAQESGEDCFQDLELSTGGTKRIIPGGLFEIRDRVKLPDGLNCKDCVLRWHYTTGNTWGECENGTGANGCGPQETYRNCADITIE